MQFDQPDQLQTQQELRAKLVQQHQQMQLSLLHQKFLILVSQPDHLNHWLRKLVLHPEQPMLPMQVPGLAPLNKRLRKLVLHPEQPMVPMEALEPLNERLRKRQLRRREQL
jgi:hypothetical protein